jgi:hypothetical protein
VFRERKLGKLADGQDVHHAFDSAAGHRACRGRGLQTKERLSLDSLNSRTGEYILVRLLGQLFFDQADNDRRQVNDLRQGTGFPG